MDSRSILWRRREKSKMVTLDDLERVVTEARDFKITGDSVFRTTSDWRGRPTQMWFEGPQK
jgi:hypothetical protein